jgi:hypothetical protein
MKRNKKGISYFDLVLAIKEGKSEKFPAETLGTMRQYVSERIKNKYPEKQYSVEGKKEQIEAGYCKVVRDFDLDLKQTA